MALHHFPRIVTDGLVLCLDAGNPLSYPSLGPELVTNSNLLVADDGNYETIKRTTTENIAVFSVGLNIELGKTYQMSWKVLNLRLSNTGAQVRRGSSFMSGAPNIALSPGFYTSTFTNNISTGNMNIYGDNTNGVDFDLDYLSVKEMSTIINDMSGNGNNAILGASTAAPVFNNSNGGCLNFDGVNDYVVSNSVTLNFDNGFTISQWLKVLNVSSNHLGSFQYRNGSNNINILFLTNRSIRLESYSVGGQLYSAAESFELNKWYNLTCTFSGTDTDGGSGMSTIYLNGISIASGTRNGFNSTTADIIVGAYPSSALYFNGYISNNQFYNKCLTSQQILDNYSATKGRYGL